MTSLLNSNIAIIAFALCLALGLVGIRVAPFLGLLDIPGGRRQHNGLVPKVGGLALVISLLLLSLRHDYRLPFTPLELTIVASMAILGFLDDRIELRARWKAILGLLFAVILAAGATHSLAHNLVPYTVLGVLLPPAPWIAFILLLLLFWCIPQAFNLIDGSNGLATGYGLVVLGSLWGSGSHHPALVGALLACLLLNWPKARLFLGDCGSLSIGLMLVIFAQKSLAMPHPNHMMWLFAYPVVDVLTVVVIRKFNHQPISVGDRSHLHYQITDRWPEKASLSVPVLLCIAAMCGSEVYLTGTWRFVPFLGLTLLLAMSAFFIAAKTSPAARAEAEAGNLPDSISAAGPLSANAFSKERRQPQRKAQWEKNLTVLNVIALLFNALRKF